MRNNLNLPDITSPYLYRLNHIFRLLGSRIIPCYFFTANPKEFIKWQFNSCNQTALIVAYFFRKLLPSEHHIDLHLWEGQFSDMHTQVYNHAWMDYHETGKHYVIIDVARMSSNMLVIWTANAANPIYNSPGLIALETRLLSKEELDYDNMIKQTEYYTGKTGLEICKDIEQVLLSYGYDLVQIKEDLGDFY